MSSSCGFDSLDLFETEIRCENGIFNVYRRYIDIIETDWELVQSGCCGNTISVDCCPNDALPTTFNISFSNATGDCVDCLDNLTTTIDWDGEKWTKTLNNNGCNIEISFICIGGGFTLRVTIDGLLCIPAFTPEQPVTNCNPFSFYATGCSLFDCCSGNIDFIIEP